MWELLWALLCFKVVHVYSYYREVGVIVRVQLICLPSVYFKHSAKMRFFVRVPHTRMVWSYTSA